MDSAADKVCLIKIVVEKNMSVNLFLKTERSNKKKLQEYISIKLDVAHQPGKALNLGVEKV